MIGIELPPTDWLEVSQARIDEFARATGDRSGSIPIPSAQPARAVRHDGRARVPDALALRAAGVEALAGLTGYGMGINYGINRVRFPAPVPAGSRIRARVTVASVDEVPGGDQAVVNATIEREGGEKPVCVAELVFRMLR